MKSFKEIVLNLRENEYYLKLLHILVLNGLLDIFEEELKDGKIDYLPLILNLMTFLHKNKKLFKDFTPDSIENIIIISVDELLTKKFNIEIDEKQLEMALELLKNTQMYKSIYKHIKNLTMKLYYKIKKNLCGCYSKPTIKLEQGSI
tara:strand:- start:16570 stop:17010 length:441 start_codon:yes stop_codon:yes gene_type:complete